jgi:hypothetical protein
LEKPIAAIDPAVLRAQEEAERERIARETARHELDLFMIEADSLRLAYKDLFTDAGPDKLRALQDRWGQVTQRIYDGDLPATEPRRTQELLISQSWRRALDMQVSRRYSSAQVKEEIEFALMLTQLMKDATN